MKDIVVLYHANCNDGFTGAWVARQKFKDAAEYIPISHSDPPVEDLDGKDVYMIDIVYGLSDIERIKKKAKSVTLLDHHATTKDIVESAPNHLYDLHMSGATIAWKYFFPEKNIPTFLKYIEDIDLWNFNMPRAEDFLAFSMTLDFDFEKWGKLVEDFDDEKKIKVHLNRGRDIKEYQDKIIEDLLENAEKVTFEGHSALVVNASVLHSQLGNAMIRKGFDIGIIWRHTKGDLIRVSLRSDKGGDVDVGKIAKMYGGGGHQSAAGFTMNEGERFPWQTKNT